MRHDKGACTYCGGPMWLREIRVRRLSISWGNSHHERETTRFHGYQPFGLGPWVLIRWSRPPIGRYTPPSMRG